MQVGGGLYQNAQSANVQAAVGASATTQPSPPFRPVAAIDTSALPESVRKLIEEHRKELQSAEKKLGENFQINGWKVQQ